MSIILHRNIQCCYLISLRSKNTFKIRRYSSAVISKTISLWRLIWVLVAPPSELVWHNLCSLPMLVCVYGYRLLEVFSCWFFFELDEDNGDLCISISENFIKVTISFILNQKQFFHFSLSFYNQLVKRSVIFFKDFNFFINKEWIVERRSEYRRSYCAFLKQARRQFHPF